MGSRYLFTCRGCGFEATVSGGFDAGFACATHTYACRDCGTLFDRAVSDAPWAFDREDVPKNFRVERTQISLATRANSGIILGHARNVEKYSIGQKRVFSAGIDVERSKSMTTGGSSCPK